MYLETGDAIVRLRWRSRPAVNLPPANPCTPLGVSPVLTVCLSRRDACAAPPDDAIRHATCHGGAAGSRPGASGESTRRRFGTWDTPWAEHPPLDATHRQIQNRIDDLPHVQAAGSSTRFGRWNQWFDNIPLAVG